ncbi:MAG: tetratricopeptide repeat protein, partial [Giesbergeria sp.]|nr:tetratricopeptide repeat protein [Giesbergeria sp.]
MTKIVQSDPVPEDDPLVLAIQEALDAFKRQDMVAALKAFTAALELDPKRADLWQDLGATYARMEAWSQCITSLEIALALEPGRPGARYVMALALYNLGEHERAVPLIDEACQRSATDVFWAMRAYIHSHTNRDPAHTLQVHRDWGRRFADPLTRKAKPLVVKDRNPRKRLKVGYVTADFRTHSVAFFMHPVLCHHNPDAVEVHVYSSGIRDVFTEAIQQSVPHWHEVMALSDEELCERIRADGIDVLVDLSGHTSGNRLLTFARRAAPVQVTWIGYMLTLGMKAMDYRLADLGVVPLGDEKYHSEIVFRLACGASYAPPEYAPLCEEPPLLRNGYPTLISLNSSAKITDAMLAVWARILQERPDARLIIVVKERSIDTAQANMQPRVEAVDMPLDRVSVMHQQPLDRFMEFGHIADVMLDTAPISGGTTTLHALWMGLPIVTLDAERAVDASSARILQATGFGYEVAANEEEYVQKALQLMNDTA